MSENIIAFGGNDPRPVVWRTGRINGNEQAALAKKSELFYGCLAAGQTDSGQ